MNFFLGMIFTFVIGSESLLAEDIRQSFHQSLSSEETLNIFWNNSGYPDNVLTRAYKGLSRTMMAEYAFLPTTKYQYFTSGRDMVESAIAEDPGNAELRYIRLMIQLNAPAFLGYRANVSEDMDILTKAIGSGLVNDEWRATFVKNLLAGECLKEEQRERLLSYL